MREGWVSDGVERLFFVESGEGPPLVFLHGGLADHQAVQPIVGSLAGRFRVVTPDLRGSGRSHTSGVLTFGILSKDVGHLLDYLGIDVAVVGGISSGSGPAVRFALDNPDRILGLVILHPIYGGKEVGYSASQTAAFAGMDAVASRAEIDGIGVLRAMYFSQLPEPMAERAWSIASSFDPTSVVATSRFVASGSQPFTSSDQLKDLSVPTLLVRGHDDVHPADISDLYADSLPDCTVIENLGPEAATALEDFMDRVTAS
jgi:pimeloyl-ACP methyl ester carboxylesterase